MTAFNVVGDAKVDKWVIEPIPGSGDVAKVYKQSESGKTVFYDFGVGVMPFELTLEKQ